MPEAQTRCCVSNSPGPLAAASLGIKDLGSKGAAWGLGKRNKLFPRLLTMVFLSCPRLTANPVGAAGKAAGLGWKRRQPRALTGPTTAPPAGAPTPALSLPAPSSRSRRQRAGSGDASAAGSVPRTPPQKAEAQPRDKAVFSGRTHGGRQEPLLRRERPRTPLAPPGCPRGPGPAPARPAPHSPRAAAAAVTSASIPRRTAEVTSQRRERFRPVWRARPGRFRRRRGRRTRKNESGQQREPQTQIFNALRPRENSTGTYRHPERAPAAPRAPHGGYKNST